MKSTKLEVCEIYTSIQGEGPTTGVPSIFIRLSGCNLHCVWCDIACTWNWEGTDFNHCDDKKYVKEDNIVMMSADEIIQEIDLIKKRYKDIDNIILTGGEPLIQQRHQEFLSFLTKCYEKGMRVEIETNGTVLPRDLTDDYVWQYNISPKLENSGNSSKLRDKSKCYNFFIRRGQDYPGTAFKFVVSNEKDLEEVMMLEEKYDIPKEMIYIMPECTTREELLKKSEWISERCLRLGYRFCNRLQVQIWGDERRR